MTLRALFILLGLGLFASPSHAGAVQVDVLTASGQPLSDAVVSLQGEGGAGAPPAATEAIMDQRDRQFDPRVLAVRTGTLVRFPNSDDIRHHVYSFSPAKRFELRLYHGTTAEPVRFDQAGKVALGCNIHDGMLGFIYVLNAQWFGVSGAEGQVTLTGIPAGDYQLQVQHPRLPEPLEQRVTVSSGGFQQQVVLEGLLPAPGQEEPESELERLFDR